MMLWIASVGDTLHFVPNIICWNGGDHTMQQRRMGTFTMGICLLVFGVLFLAHTFVKTINYGLIFHLWPFIFILLGGEILYYSVKGKDSQMKYDFAAIILLMLLAVFAMGMAGMDLLFEHIPADYWIHW